MVHMASRNGVEDRFQSQILASAILIRWQSGALLCSTPFSKSSALSSNQGMWYSSLLGTLRLIMPTLAPALHLIVQSLSCEEGRDQMAQTIARELLWHEHLLTCSHCD